LPIFGGAGGQHACLVADALGIQSVLIHPFSGLLSAYGIGMSGVFASRQQGFVRPLADDNADEIHAAIEALRKPVFEELAAKDVPVDDISWRPVLHVRYDGTDTTLPVNHAALSVAEARTAFETAHKAQFGFIYSDRA